jgi:hypothetical protein
MYKKERLKAEADNTNPVLDNYRYHCEKANPIIVLLLSAGMTSYLQTIPLSVDIICRCDK